MENIRKNKDFKPNNCPVTHFMNKVGGKWKTLILYAISKNHNRFSMLQKVIPLISKQMLVNQLRELEDDNIIDRKIFAEIPPRVEYSISEYGQSMMPIILTIQKWGIEDLKKEATQYTDYFFDICKIGFKMNIETFIKDWIAVGNSYNTEKYLEFYNEDAVLDDPSVGRKFVGHHGIKDYFVSYFIGYKTQTELRKLEIKENTAYLEVEFTGDFPEGKIGGSFDFTFKNDKIEFVKADLI